MAAMQAPAVRSPLPWRASCVRSPHAGSRRSCRRPRQPLPGLQHLLVGGDLPPGQLDLGLRRGEDAVGDLQLSGMNQRLAVEAQIAALLALGFQPGLILELVVDPVGGDHVMGPGGQQNGLQRHLHRQAVRPRAAVQLLGQVIGAGDEALHTGVRGDLQRVEDGQRGFHHRPDRHVAERGQRVDVGSEIDLGQQDRVDVGALQRGHVPAPPFGVQPVDPHDLGPRAKAPFGQRGGERDTRAHLGLGHHGIFQIEQDRIDRKAARLLQRAVFRAWDIEKGTVGAQGGFHGDNLS